jgi:TIR domain
MNIEKKISLLQRLLSQANEIKIRTSNDPIFKTWKNTVERTLIRVFGDNSPELQQFNNLRFFYRGVIMQIGKDYSGEHRKYFDNDFNILISSINNYIEELQQDYEEESSGQESSDSHGVERIFISHSSQDAPFVEELVDLLELIGIQGEKIFCTSFTGYGIDLGENFLDVIKEELHSDTLVLFILSTNFYSSPICLCEMGATWVLTKEHIPILIPPFNFSDVKGVIPLTQGFRINDELKLNLFKEKIESIFGVSSNLNQSAWERKRDRIVKQLNEKIEAVS